jgi:MFS transporter, DHA1 family, inner membrane transport protein
MASGIRNDRLRVDVTPLPGRRVVPVVAAIMIGVIAALVVNTLPVFLSVLARTLHLSDSQSGLVAFADMGGIALGTTYCALSRLTTERLTWRWAAVLGLLILGTANLLSGLIPGFSLLLLARACAGFGSGIAMAISYAILAQGDGARDLAIFNVAQLAAGWLGIPLLGPIADRYGAGALFVVIAVLALGAVLLCSLLPTRPGGNSPSPAVQVQHAKISVRGWIAIAGVFLYFGGAGATFANLAFMGIAWGGVPREVETNISIMMFWGVLGGVLVAVIGSRFGLRRPLYVSFAVFLLSIAALTVLRPVAQFLLIGCVFGFSWNILTPYQFEAVTVIDRSSSAAMMVNAATLGGFAVGPALAGFLASPDYMAVNILAISACAVSLTLLSLVLRPQKLGNSVG